MYLYAFSLFTNGTADDHDKKEVVLLLKICCFEQKMEHLIFDQKV